MKFFYPGRPACLVPAASGTNAVLHIEKKCVFMFLHYKQKPSNQPKLHSLSIGSVHCM